MILVTYPNPILTKPCAPVEVFDQVLADQAAELLKFSTVLGGHGLAANQVGSPLRYFVVSDRPEFRECPKVFVNPTLVDLQEPTVHREGCMSIPGVYASRRRFGSLQVRYQDLSGVERLCAATDLFAFLCQHEVDHLDGKLFIDDLDFIQKGKVTDKLNKLRKVRDHV